MTPLKETLLADARAFLGGRCVVCGTYENLQFDHIDRSTKLGNVTTLARGTTEAAFWVEVKKCQLLCKEHHREKSRIEQIGVPGHTNGGPRPRPPVKRGQWNVTAVELLQPEAGVSLLRGGAVLLGAGVQATCSNGPTEAVLTISVHDDGGLVCTSICVTGSQGISSTDLHLVPVGRLIREAFASLDENDWRPQRAADAAAVGDAVIRHWMSLQGGSDGHRATQATADALGYSRGYVSRLLSRARKDGLIPPLGVGLLPGSRG